MQRSRLVYSFLKIFLFFLRQFCHKFKCSSRKTKAKKTVEDYEVLKDSNGKDIILGKGALGLVKLVKDNKNHLFALKTVNE